jgi:ABC-2 type transport system permease protein
MRDTSTVVWKEWKGMFHLHSGPLNGPLPYVAIIAVAGVSFALPVGEAYATSWRTVFLVVSATAFAVSSVICDSVAGERERHTLETLLASRLPDHAIVIGKLLAAVLHAWMTAALLLVAGLLTAVLRFGGSALTGGLSSVFLSVLFSLLVAVLVGGVGIVASLRAPTVKLAQQSFFVSLMTLFFIPIVASRLLRPDLRAAVVAWGARLGGGGLLVWGGVLLCLLDVVVIAVALRRFRRPSLLSGR